MFFSYSALLTSIKNLKDFLLMANKYIHTFWTSSKKDIFIIILKFAFQRKRLRVEQL